MKPKNLFQGTLLYPHEKAATLECFELSRDVSQKEKMCPLHEEKGHMLSGYLWSAVEETQLKCLRKTVHSLAKRYASTHWTESNEDKTHRTHLLEQVNTILQTAKTRGYVF